MKRHFLYIACIFICSIVFAQSSENVGEGPTIYTGARVGMPVGVGSFSGFNADFPGWDAGVFAGYHFNNMMSVEVDAGFGHLDMLSRNFCKDVFWNEAEDIKYSQLKNKTFIHRYSASSVSNIDAVQPETPSSEDSVLVDMPETVVLTLDQRRSNALEGLVKYPDAVLVNVVSFVDSLMASSTTYSDLCDKMTWLAVEVLPEIRKYESVSEQVSKADSLIFALSRIAEADSLLNKPMKKDAVRAMSSELATLNMGIQFIADKIESTRTLLNRYYLTTTWTMDIIERLEGAKGADDSALQVSDVFKEYEGNGRLEMIREIPFMNEIVSRLISCFPYSESGYDVQSADWTKITEIKTVIENSRK